MKIITIGSPLVWPEFVKRLPRTNPRFHNPKLAEQQAEQAKIFAEARRPVSEQELSVLALQMQANRQPFPFQGNSSLGAFWLPPLW